MSESNSNSFPREFVKSLLQQGTSSSTRQSALSAEQTFVANVKEKVLSLDTTTESRKIAAIRRGKQRRVNDNSNNDDVDFDERQRLFRRQFVARRRGVPVQSVRVRPRLQRSDTVSFKAMQEMNRLWVQYIDALGRGRPGSATALPLASGQLREKLMRADLHGALVRVAQSRNRCAVGLVGIVLVESKLAFQIVTRDNEVKLVPKQHTAFDVHHPTAIFRFFGNQLLTRAAERSTKKCKSIAMKNQ
jgi:RNase P/RNase MRP subunit p29